MKKLFAAIVMATALLFAGSGGAVASEGPHQVLVCKYVGTPGVDERLQTGQNPIVVDTHALEGDGFDGTFPFEFSDAQGRSVAIRFLGEDESPGDQFDIGECPAVEEPSPTPTPTPSPSPEPSPTPAPSPAPKPHHGKPNHPNTSGGLPVTGISSVEAGLIGAALFLTLVGMALLWSTKRPES